MPDFEVTSPDGKTFIVSAPEGATQDQALAYAKEQHAAAPPSGPPVGRLRSIAQGVGDMAYGGAQLMAHTFSGFEQNPVVQGVGRALGMETNTPAQIDEKVTTRESDYQAKRKAAGESGIDGYRMLGNVVGAAPLAAVLPIGATVGGAIGAGAVGGAVTGALEPVTGPDYWQGKRNQLLASTAGGAAFGPAGLVAGRLIAPRIAPAVRTLNEAGVDLTPGQIVGGTAQRLEDAAQSIPVVGDAIRGARRRGLESFNRSAANEALEPIGQRIGAATPAGREMVQETGDQISGAYGRAYAQAQPFGPDAQFAADLQQIGQQFLTPASQNIFARALQNDVISRIQAAGGQIDAETFQAIKQELGNRTRQFAGSQEPHNRELADAFRGVLDAMHGLMGRSNPQTAPLLQQADAAFARNVRVEGAAGRVASPDGVFTPAQLSGAVRAADGSVRHNAYARGNALMQDLSDAGKAVLPSTVPDSGTGLRATLNALALGGAAYVEPVTAGIGAGLMAAYTRPAQRFAQRGVLAPRSAGVTAAGEAVAGSGGVLGGVVANEWGRPLPNRLLQD